MTWYSLASPLTKLLSPHGRYVRREKEGVKKKKSQPGIMCQFRGSCLNSGTERELETLLLLQLPSYSCSSPSSSSSLHQNHFSFSSHPEVNKLGSTVTASFRADCLPPCAFSAVRQPPGAVTEISRGGNSDLWWGVCALYPCLLGVGSGLRFLRQVRGPLS